jgi:transposase
MIYTEIRKLEKAGFSRRKIAKQLGVSRNTVSNYLEKNSEEMAIWLAGSKTRKRKLDEHSTMILDWLRQYPDLSSSQIHDWLEERGVTQISSASVRRYVQELRDIHHIPKVSMVRAYEAVAEAPIGFQAQVDFGETWVQKASGSRIKLYVAAFVMSYSRYKYMFWQDRPLTTIDLIKIHEKAFKYFGGKPKELVYDQDSIIVVSENGGDIVYTRQFDVYQQTEPFQVFMCRGADPQTKGKIENVIGFIKKNFAKHRLFYDLNRWNQEALQWLVRKGNGKQHNITKQVPAVMFEEEQRHLIPGLSKRLKTNSDTTVTRRTVRKDNTIMYQSNRYSVPLGTFHTRGVDVDVYVTDGMLTIMNTETGEVIAKHDQSLKKGMLIQATQHKRNRMNGIAAMVEKVIACFDDKEDAMQFVDELKLRYPRYIRDQLQIILDFSHCHSREELTATVRYCVGMNIYSANDFKDVHYHLYHNLPIIDEQKIDIDIPVGYYSAETERKLALIQTETRHLEIYTKLMEVH